MRLGRIAVYLDRTKSTSGQRFFEALVDRLRLRSVDAPADESQVVLFNISAPLAEIALAKARGQTVVLRVDGLYLDRLSPEFVARFRWPMRSVLRAGSNVPAIEHALSHVANFLDENWTSFARIVLADHIVYQSQFSRRIHAHYFPQKPYTVIVNGATYDGNAEQSRSLEGPALALVTTFDDWRPSKRIDAIIRFVEWANETAGANVRLTILGYTGKFPSSASPGIARLVSDKPYFRTLPRFSQIEGDVREALIDADAYITFSLRDSCPNVVIEAMAHGLPVLGVESGGLPDIVRDAGTLLSGAHDDRLFTAGRFENDFPRIDFAEVLRAARLIKSQSAEYRMRVRRRFETDLDLDIVASRYLAVLQALA